MNKTQRNSFKLNPVAASIILAIASQMTANVAQAGSGWGAGSYAAAPALTVPVQTYYANSPVGPVTALDPVTGLPTINSVTNLPVTIDTGKALRKFVDTLPGIPGITSFGANNLGQYIPVAVPEKWTDAAGNKTDDYYEIAAVEFSEQLHSDLPKTHLRGYVQLSTAANPGKHIALNYPNGSPILDAGGAQVYAYDNPHHLGPIIQAASNTAVRVKFTNYLPVGGNLFLPVDKSITGAGLGPDGKTYYTENRAEIHLVGGQAPWISAGSPHQWIAPAGETAAYAAGLGKGPSAQNVPDMADPGAGSSTLYFPNTQSARFMFYQDRTSGLTRLNSYAGLEAGYLITDPTEAGLIASGAIPADQIPLIIEDKTFVPANIAQQDAKWDTTHWGQPGDLWFPHVYETNQDPKSVNGTNPVGRWDYGPWFWPIFAATAPLPSGEYGNASFVPESYEDTPLVNGTAYPTVTVDPKAYRFRILNASNDRYINLGLYKADATVKAPQLDRNGNPIVDATGTQLFFTNTEVKMVPAVADVTGAPPALLAYADQNCQCQYPNLPQLLSYAFSGPTRAWPTDGRTGGTPDPASVGPDFIAIGTDGGFLPNPVDIPSQPITYEANRRSVTVTNVYGYGLLVGPSERTDAIVDFSAYAGQTLILYNDAPTPFPFDDQRVDYFTGAPDQTGSGGAYSTLPGYGPNTRTIMQIVVNPTILGTIPAVPFNAATLLTALPAAYGASQPKPIVPEIAYNVAFGTNNTDNYAHVATGSVAQPNLDFTSSGTFNITGVNLISSGGQLISGTNNIVGNAVPGSGTGYLSAPAVSFVFPVGATCTTYPAATATVFNTPIVSSIKVTNGGTGYRNPVVTVSAPAAGGTQATATATLSKGVVTAITVTNPGSGYTAAPTIKITDTARNAKGASASPVMTDPSYQVTGVTVTTQGAACNAPPDVIFTPTNGGVGAQAAIVTSSVLLTQSIPVLTKAEQELFDASGRYNSTGGVELPLTSGTTQTTIPLNYIDAPTEIIGDSETQIWKLVDNGFWSNSMHFDFVDVQLINRVGWDGTVKAPASNEVGWKDTLRLNPLEDVVIAMRAKRPSVPFGQPQSTRSQDPSKPLGVAGSGLGFTADPGVLATNGVTQLLTATTNTNLIPGSTIGAAGAVLKGNYDNEYVWNTAILGHSEDDFTRPIVYQPTVTVPDAPTIMSGSGGTLVWTDPTPAGGVDAFGVSTLGNAKNEIGFNVLRATYGQNGLGNNPQYTVVGAVSANATTFTDTTQVAGSDYSYKVQAWNAAGATASAPYTEITAPAVPAGLTAAISNTGAVTLTWAASAGATGYLVSVNGGTAVLVTNTNYRPVLALGSNYTITVAAQKIKYGLTSNSAAASITVNLSAPAAPAAPTGLGVVYSAGSTSATLNWTDSTTAGVTGYIVQQSANGGTTWTQVGNVLGATAKTSNVTVANGNTYLYQVFAQIALYNSPVTTTNSPASNQASLLTTPVAPAVVSNVVATLASGPSVALTWAASATPGATYIIQRKTGGNGTYTTIGTSATASYNDATATAGNTYTYQVAAQSTNAAGTTTSAYVASSSVTLALPAAPNAPASLTATVASATSVGLAWPASTTGGVTYVIQRKTGNGAYAILVSLPAGSTGYTDTTVVAGNSYTYEIAAIATNTVGSTTGSYRQSSSVSTALPANPSNVTVAANGTGSKSITITWTENPTTNVSGYVIQVRSSTTSATAGFGNWGPAGTATSTTFTHTGLLTNTWYEYSVTATGVTGSSAAVASTTGVKPR